MQINSVQPMSFGKISITLDAEQKENLYQHAAYGIGEGSVDDFNEKYRLANRLTRFDINVDNCGADVVDRETRAKTQFSADKFGDYPNALYHMLNVAMNYVMLKDNETFESEDKFTKSLKQKK